MPEIPAGGTETASPRVGVFRLVSGYFRALYRGELPLARVFWTDMILIGSMVNIVGTAAAMLLFVSGAPIALGVFVHFAPVPYNVLLFLSVWQAAAREASAWSFIAQAVAMIWLVTAIVL